MIKHLMSFALFMLVWNVALHLVGHIESRDAALFVFGGTMYIYAGIEERIFR